MVNVLLGVTGGISAYKAADIISALRKFDYAVRVIMTERAKDFITPLTLATLSKNHIYDDKGEWAPHGRIDHIELADWAHIFVVAPATANTIAKLAQGITDNLLTSTYLAFTGSTSVGKKFLLCPAMNTNMYENTVTQKNLKEMERTGHYFVPPVEGLLACGAYGLGKLAPTKIIIDKIREFCS
jgi:phosphopantothenoylcysteine synthetase/decarboxylase